MVAELNGTMALKYISSLVLLTDKYRTWKKEMQIWKMAMCVEKVKWALIVFLSLEVKARKAVLELDIVALNSEDEMEKVYEKLVTILLEDINQSAFLANETFEGYRREPDTSIENFLIKFVWHVTKLKDFNILLPEPVLAFRILKSAYLTLENERFVKATIGELTLYYGRLCTVFWCFVFQCSTYHGEEWSRCYCLCRRLTGRLQWGILWLLFELTWCPF